MMKKFGFGLLLLMLIVPTAFGMEDRHLCLLGGINYGLDSASATATNGSTTVSATVKGSLGFGGGVTMAAGPLEFGALYLSRKFTTQVTGQADSSTSSNVFEIPVMYRLSALNFGIGGFYDFGSNNSSDYGLTAGPRLGNPNSGLFLDLRFNYGLKSGNSKNILAMIGLHLGK